GTGILPDGVDDLVQGPERHAMRLGSARRLGGQPGRDDVPAHTAGTAESCREGLDLVADHVAVDLTATDEVGPGYLQPVIPDRWDCDQMNGQADNHGHLRSRWRGVRPRGDPVWQQDHTHSLAVPEGDLQRAQQAVDVRVAVADIGGPDLGDEGGVDDAATFPRP